MKTSKVEKINEKKFYDVAAYIGIFSFLWNVPSWWVRILIGGILSENILFNSSNFPWIVVESVLSTVQVLILLLLIGKGINWKSSTICFLS